MTLLEPNIYGLWLGKQSAKGSPNTSPGKRMVHVAGGLNWQREDGSENYSDGTKYGTSSDWVNTLLGSGEPGIEATPIESAYLWWLFSGAETIVNNGAVVGPPAIPATTRHVYTPSLGKGFWFTAFTKVGASNVIRQQHNDCLITKIVMESSTANKPLRITPTIVSLDPGYPYTSDPTATLPTERTFLHTDLAVAQGGATDGSLALNGTTFRGVTQYTFTVDDAWTPQYGDNYRPYDLSQGTPTVAVSATLLLDADALALWNTLAYGSSTPAAGTAPLTTPGANGSFAATSRQRSSSGASNGLQCDIAIPSVKWTVPPAPEPNPDGGATEIVLAGAMRSPSSGSQYTVGFNLPTGTAAFTS